MEHPFPPHESRTDQSTASGGDDQPPGSGRGVRRRFATLAVVGALIVAILFGSAAGSALTLYLVRGQGSPLAAAATVAGQPNSPAPAQESPTPADSGASGAIANAPATVWQAASLADVYERVAPSVVTVEIAGSPNRPRTGGAGSGFFVDAEGHVVTNYHVVSGGSQIRVVLRDGSQYSAKVVGTDPLMDLALLDADVPRDKVVPAVLGDSSLVRPGDPVFAVGTPFGFEQSVTAGIVSGVDRTFGSAGGRQMRGLIQTDAPVNPGNSGGPLFNAAGEVIGIATSIESPVRGSVGVGFAIPSNAASRLLPDLVAGQSIEHPWLGIAGIAITDSVATELGLPVRQGVLVTEVVPDGPAAKAGVRGGQGRGSAVPTGGDIIVAVDDREVRSVEQVSGYLDTKRVGDTVRLRVIRDGQETEIDVQLGAWPYGEES